MTTPTSSPAACTSAEDPQSLQDPVLGGVLETSATDSAVRPQDDLFRFVNGQWLATAEIPADRPSSGAFTTLRDEAEAACRQIVEELAEQFSSVAPEVASEVLATNRGRVGALYEAFMDEAHLEELGAEPLAEELAPVLGASSKEELARALGEMTPVGFMGVVGADVEVAVRNLYYAADKDVERAEHGIIYLDEFDKIARKSGANNSITADPGHEGVQQALLKMLEGSVVEFTARGQRKHPEAPTIKVDTKNILFIVGGAFVGIEKVISKRLKKGNVAIGFGAEVRGKDIEKEFDTLIHQVTPEDLMEYGIIPEIIGRLPVICTLETLDEDALLRILTEPINAPVRQYEKLLAMDGVELVFTEDALRAVAKKAIERKTGARSLKGIIEEVMLDVMFDIPRENAPRRVTITAECITEGAAPIIENAAAG